MYSNEKYRTCKNATKKYMKSVKKYRKLNMYIIVNLQSKTKQFFKLQKLILI